ncbi:HlyD family type I secretion periplasmic adaptor subunit [Celeribacter persicus]|jgi:type I secretion membrane fusion protein, HlyD family|uniref:Membrane fusion protein (MFP) family protein n=1 Tax=Celeribacter persicus TaxID=1651082 RepID=A0A2T5HTC5_9RHOB|nr:HlyD family type I secretion periplasmic adaptor subunit [Celeribacter persicus]PTQ74833.1 HlyD family secretion protein [Celeribacter persicus]
MSAPTAWPARRTVMFGLFCVALLIGGFGGWSVFARIDGAVVASGQVQVEQNRQAVAHRDGGEVAAVYVSESNQVAEGELLISLSPDEYLSELALIETQLFESMARAARLEAERDGADELTLPEELVTRMAEDPQVARSVTGQRDLFTARRETARAEIDQLDKQRNQIEVQIDGLASQKAALSEQLTLLEEDLAAQNVLLDRGLTQQSRVIGLRRDAVSLAAEIGRIDSSEAQAQVQITEIELQILKVGSDRRESAITELRDIQAEIGSLREQRSALRARLDRLDIRAPVAGVIYGLTVFGPGAVVQPAQPVLYIVPQDRPLIITASVSPTHVDQVYPGQPVRLRFTSFDRRTTPELEGQVTRVSPDAFTDEVTGASFYRTDIHIPEEQRARLPDGSVLIPGMPVEAYMATGERSPIAYLTKPLTDYFTRAFRED